MRYGLLETVRLETVRLQCNVNGAHCAARRGALRVRAQRADARIHNTRTRRPGRGQEQARRGHIPFLVVSHKSDTLVRVCARVRRSRPLVARYAAGHRHDRRDDGDAAALFARRLAAGAHAGAGPRGLPSGMWFGRREAASGLQRLLLRTRGAAAGPQRPHCAAIGIGIKHNLPSLRMRAVLHLHEAGGQRVDVAVGSGARDDHDAHGAAVHVCVQSARRRHVADAQVDDPRAHAHPRLARGHRALLQPDGRPRDRRRRQLWLVHSLLARARLPRDRLRARTGPAPHTPRPARSTRPPCLPSWNRWLPAVPPLRRCPPTRR